MGAVETLPYRQTRASGGFRLFGLELPRRPFDLERANLSGHWLQYENFRGANLISANLSGANLSGAGNLTREQLDKACGDQNTKLGDDLKDLTLKPC
jgi:uncharacterized protein YjbI with pentapeptide repeats